MALKMVVENVKGEQIHIQTFIWLTFLAGEIYLLTSLNLLSLKNIGIGEKNILSYDNDMISSR